MKVLLERLERFTSSKVQLSEAIDPKIKGLLDTEVGMGVFLFMLSEPSPSKSDVEEVVDYLYKKDKSPLAVLKLLDGLVDEDAVYDGLLGKIINLKDLDLTYKKLSTLPESIGELKNLRELDASMNNLTSLPESIGKLKNLTELYLGGNKLTSLPESIGKLKNLIILYLRGNVQLRTLPDSIGDLKNLRELELRGRNQRTILPSSIKKLKNLKIMR